MFNIYSFTCKNDMIGLSINPVGLKSGQIKDYLSHLSDSRIIFLTSEINDDTATYIVSQLLFFDSMNNKPIYMYINSPGGSVYASLSIINIMQSIKSPIYTINMGLAASMAALILASGQRGKRLAFRFTVTMIHQPSTSLMNCAASQAKNYIDSLLYLKHIMKEILIKYTDQPLSKIEQDLESEYYMNADEALKYNIIDNIIDNLPSEETN